MPLNQPVGALLGENAGGAYQRMTQDIYQSYTGVDMQATISLGGTPSNPKNITKLVGTLASVTVSTVREVAPLYVMGRTNYVAVSKGKRSISGTLVFTVFDRDPITRDLIDPRDLDNLKSQWDTLNSVARDNPTAVTAEMLSVLSNMKVAIAATQALQSVIGTQPIKFADQLAPFDITISLVNDQGSASVANIKQVTIISSGWGVSMHDMESDMVFQYIARDYEPLTALTDIKNTGSASW